MTLHTCRLPGDGGTSSASQRRRCTEDGGAKRGKVVVVEMLDTETSGETAGTWCSAASGEEA